MGWLPKKCVVVPFDFSEQSDQSLESAQVFVESLAGLHVVHVLPTIELAEPGSDLGDDRRRGPPPSCGGGLPGAIRQDAVREG